MLSLKYRRLELFSLKELFEVRDMLRRLKELKIEIDSALETEVESYLTGSVGQECVVAQYY